jgi:hypothetical protein
VTLLEREEKPSEVNEPTGGSHLSFVEEEGESTLSGFLAGWAMGRLWSRAEWFPWGLLSFFYFFSFSILPIL